MFRLLECSDHSNAPTIQMAKLLKCTGYSNAQTRMLRLTSLRKMRVFNGFEAGVSERGGEDLQKKSSSLKMGLNVELLLSLLPSYGR